MPGRARLLLHIGAGKCGSTAIQQFLARNQQRLRERGYLLPGPRLEADVPSVGQQVWYFNDCLRAPEQHGAEFRQRLLSLTGAHPVAGASTLILSAENLSSARHAAKLFAPLRDSFDLRILCYIRRQDDYLISFWQQWGFKQSPDFWAWLMQSLQPGGPGDWLADIDPWAQVFGDAAICLRRFGRRYFADGNLLRDFCVAAGIDTRDLDLAQQPNNIGFDDSLMEAAYHLRDLFKGPHDVDFFEMAARWAGPAVQRSGISQQLNQAQREAVLKHFAARNAVLKQRFFAELSPDEPLFEPPRATRAPNSGQPCAQTPETAQIDLCLRLLYGAYQDITQLRQRLDALTAVTSLNNNP